MLAAIEIGVDGGPDTTPDVVVRAQDGSPCPVRLMHRPPARSALALPHPGRREHPEPEPPRTFWSVNPAGCAGTRLWPVSRSGQPKFLLRLVTPQRSLLRDTIDRLQALNCVNLV